MRAKKINEVQNFERGIDPKRSMGIGGVNPSEILINKMREAWEEFKAFGKSLEGKTITGEFGRYTSSNRPGYHEEDEGIFTFKVKELFNENFESVNNLNHPKTKLYFISDEPKINGDDVKYFYYGGKIYIENES